MNIKALLSSKSFWLGVSGIAGGAVLIINGQIQEGISAIGAGLALIFIRDAIAKK